MTHMAIAFPRSNRNYVGAQVTVRIQRKNVPLSTMRLQMSRHRRGLWGALGSTWRIWINVTATQKETKSKSKKKERDVCTQSSITSKHLASIGGGDIHGESPGSNIHGGHTSIGWYFGWGANQMSHLAQPKPLRVPILLFVTFQRLWSNAISGNCVDNFGGILSAKFIIQNMEQYSLAAGICRAGCRVTLLWHFGGASSLHVAESEKIRRTVPSKELKSSSQQKQLALRKDENESRYIVPDVAANSFLSTNSIWNTRHEQTQVKILNLSQFHSAKPAFHFLPWEQNILPPQELPTHTHRFARRGRFAVSRLAEKWHCRRTPNVRLPPTVSVMNLKSLECDVLAFSSKLNLPTAFPLFRPWPSFPFSKEESEAPIKYFKMKFSQPSSKSNASVYRCNSLTAVRFRPEYTKQSKCCRGWLRQWHFTEENGGGRGGGAADIVVDNTK